VKLIKAGHRHLGYLNLVEKLAAGGCISIDSKRSVVRRRLPGKW
jgi:hypothetical protein